MLTEENIIKRRGNEVILKETKKRTRYYKGLYVKGFTQIRNITPINKKVVEKFITN